MSADLQPEVAEPEVAAPPAPAPVILKVGNKVLAGDWGFDPLQLGDTEKVCSPCLQLATSDLFPLWSEPSW